jgi:ATP-dependent RNA helicase SUPV3L1/SUV3
MPALLKPEALRWRAAFLAARGGDPVPPLPPASGAVVVAEVRSRPAMRRLGFRAAGPQMIRVDMADRIAARAHEARVGKVGEAIDQQLVTSLGLAPDAVIALMRDLGFQPSAGDAKWVWRGRRRPRPRRPAPASSPFAALAALRGG